MRAPAAGRRLLRMKQPVGRLGGPAPALAVLRRRDGWQVVGPNGGWRTFAFQVDAEEAALRLARQAARTAPGVQVLVQDQCGQLRPLDAA